MALLGLLLALLLGGHPQQAQISGHHTISSPADTLGEATGG